MKSFKLVWLSVLGALIVGCATPTLQQQAAKADYGMAPSNSQQTVKNYFGKNLYQPNSLVIKSASQPYKGYCYDPAFVPKGQNFGWGIKATVNAKDKMGNYLGWKNYVLFYRNGTVYNAFEIIPPQIADGYVRPM